MFSVLVLISTSAIADNVTLDSVFSAQVELNEIDAFGGAVDQAFFNVQGDDDDFSVYSLVDFDTAAAGGSSAGLVSLTLQLTQSNAFFSSDGGLEFFLAEDTRDVDLADSARYVSSGDPLNPNTGSSVVGSAFGILHPLGFGTYTETTTGDIDSFDLTFDAAGEAFAINQISTGGILRIIATPTDGGVQATYSGAGQYSGSSFASYVDSQLDSRAFFGIGWLDLFGFCFDSSQAIVAEFIKNFSKPSGDYCGRAFLYYTLNATIQVSMRSIKLSAFRFAREHRICARTSSSEFL